MCEPKQRVQNENDRATRLLQGEGQTKRKLKYYNFALCNTRKETFDGTRMQARFKNNSRLAIQYGGEGPFVRSRPTSSTGHL